MLLTVLGLRAERSTDPNEIATLVRQAVFTGEKLFAPAGGVVFAAGDRDDDQHRLGLGQVLGRRGPSRLRDHVRHRHRRAPPLARKIDALIAEQGPAAPETQAAIQRILLVARVDVTVLLLVVADMVTKLS